MKLVEWIVFENDSDGGPAEIRTRGRNALKWNLWSGQHAKITIFEK